MMQHVYIILTNVYTYCMHLLNNRTQLAHKPPWLKANICMMKTSEIDMDKYLKLHVLTGANSKSSCSIIREFYFVSCMRNMANANSCWYYHRLMFQSIIDQL